LQFLQFFKIQKVTNYLYWTTGAKQKKQKNCGNRLFAKTMAHLVFPEPHTLGVK
jgi:hypothetical protein